MSVASFVTTELGCFYLSRMKTEYGTLDVLAVDGVQKVQRGRTQNRHQAQK